MRRYESYSSKDTPWGSEFPSHWQKNKLGRVTSKIGSGATLKGGSQIYIDHGVAFVRSTNVHNGGFKFENLAYIDDEAARELDYVALQKNDVLINIAGSILRSCVVPEEVLPARINQNVAILRPRNLINSRYLAYWLISSAMYQYMYSQSAGSTLKAVTKAQLNSFPVMLPPLEEQSAIANFLDSKTTEIDNLVENLKHEIELLERYRRELIAHTVTRGLNPDAPMRDSGIEWVGEIPCHWSALRISSLYDERSMKVNDQDFLPLSVTMKGILPQLETVAKTNNGDSRKLIRKGDFVINSRSDRRGACGIADRDGSCSLINIVLKPRHSICNPFFNYMFRSSIFADEFYKWGHGIVDDLWTTRWSDMKVIQVPVPPLDEQKEIAEFLDRKISEIDSTITNLDKQIELLGKYRKQIINDAVTGKIRVEGTE